MGTGMQEAVEEGEFVGARLDACLCAARFASPPSADEFGNEVEPKNVPAVFRGVAKGWAASTRWDPLHGGLDYLLVSVPFSTFIQSCKSYLGWINAASDSFIDQGIFGEPTCSREMCSSNSENSEQVYLAQASTLHKPLPYEQIALIGNGSNNVVSMNAENKERCSLEVLKEDIQEPIFLRGKSFSSINFWMNGAHLRSSTHYDPHHNLLCVLAGCKKVTLWPPSASPFLYPMPVYGEASNHSSVSIEEPDYSSYTRARCMKEYSERVTLNCGDVLFIPEGWYHQVDSDDLTIAINFWWKSRIMTQMLEHMDAYYLCRILSRQNIMVQRSPFCHLGDCTNIQPMDKALTGFQLFNLQKDSPLQTLEPSTLQALYELVSLVHDRGEVVNQNDRTEPASESTSSNQGDKTKIAAPDDSSLLDKDPVAKTILPVEPLELRSMMLAMVRTFPRTLETLVLNMLGPVGAEILTRKFDEIDQLTTKEEQAEFYKTFYSVFEDQYAAMDVLLNGKELFSFQVFQNVLDKYLRVHVDRPS
ncbi:uncharacterized protein C2845_PM07G24600 [Panicum miliaceum]|uniref:JmjC domain-containing protein n=1 Tax=Panicum miliaceum TaxID=4540 RepID=A0A3L6SQ41_PANMI|nr:uncharacterized protein C2845_PM07G24600 [Panicum miliaceum]